MSHPLLLFAVRLARRACILLAVVVAPLFWVSGAGADPGIVGTWTGTDSDGDQATFVFGGDMAAEIKLEGVPRLSTQTVTNGHVEWAGDVSADPMPIDVIIVRTGQEVGRIPMLVRLQDDGTLLLQLSRDMKTRPTSFEITGKVFQVVAHRE